MIARGRAVLTAIVMLLPAITVAGTGAASAASLGGLIPAKLTTSTIALANSAPSVIAWENFNGTSTNISGSTTDGGSKIWIANPIGSSWPLSSNKVSASSGGTLVFDAGVADHTTVATLFRNGGVVFDTGLRVAQDLANTQALECTWSSSSGGSIEIWKYNSGSTKLASVTNLYPGGMATAPASIVLGCSITATTVTAIVNGVAAVSYTLTAAEQTMYRNTSHRHTGLRRGPTSGATFDDFHVDVP